MLVNRQEPERSESHLITWRAICTAGRRLAAFGAAGLLAAVVWVSHVEAEERPIEVIFNEKQLVFEQDPVNLDGTTLVPFRALFEAMDIAVGWDGERREVTGTKEGLNLTLTIDSKTAVVNGKQVQLEQAPRIMADVTMVPLRFVSETTGALVAWNGYKPQIIVYTDSFIRQNGATREQVQDMIDKELARIKQEYEREQERIAANAPPTPVDVPEAPKGSVVYKPADKAELANLQGMYYGFRPDYDGMECGGVCWDLYTFLPDKLLVVGVPQNGGPETIDCEVDNCQSYTIQNGKLSLADGSTMEIGVKDGELYIGGVQLSPVEPAANDLRLNDTYVNIGFSGLVGISSGSTSWRNQVTFFDNGTFRSSDLMIGSVQGGAPTQGAAGRDDQGSYRITGNTIVFAFENGTVRNDLFFVHQDSERGELGDIQLNDDNFYIDND